MQDSTRKLFPRVIPGLDPLLPLAEGATPLHSPPAQPVAVRSNAGSPLVNF
jgi:hypothetical protein